MGFSIRHKLHHYFLPHESNNYKARALHAGVICYYILVLFALQLSKHLVRNVAPNVLGYATNITIEKTLELVNQKRKEVGLGSLILSSELSVAATQKAADMFSKDYWAHVSPTGTTPWKFINDAGYQYIYAGENLAKSFDTTEEMVEAWMNSLTHRANILKPEYTEIGLSVMNGKLRGEETTLVVQEFGSRTTVAANSKSAAPSSLALTPSPTTVIPYPQTEQLGKSTSSLRVFLSTFNLHISKRFSLSLAEFLLVVLFIDSIYIAKNKIYRISSHSIAHIIFLLALIGAMTATGVGVIL